VSETLHIALGRRYHFAASHRLHSAKLSEQENNRVFGKCNNPYGHGHNYVLEVLFSGAADPATGMIANLQDDVPIFRELVPTTENLCTEIFKRLKSFPAAKLEAVRIDETSNNSFVYEGN